MRPYVLGVAGGTASGKTLLTAALAQALGNRCAALEQDRFYRSGSADTNFDAPDAIDQALFEQVLAALRRGETTQVPTYDFATHSRTQVWDALAPRDVLLVEGTLVLAMPAIRASFDASCFVDAPADIRLMRRIRRDVRDRGRGVEDVLDQYERTVRPMHDAFVEPSRGHAQHIIDGQAPVAAGVESLLRVLPARPSGT